MHCAFRWAEKLTLLTVHSTCCPTISNTTDGTESWIFNTNTVSAMPLESRSKIFTSAFRFWERSSFIFGLLESFNVKLSRRVESNVLCWPSMLPPFNDDLKHRQHLTLFFTLSSNLRCRWCSRASPWAYSGESTRPSRFVSYRLNSFGSTTMAISFCLSARHCTYFPHERTPIDSSLRRCLDPQTEIPFHRFALSDSNDHRDFHRMPTWLIRLVAERLKDTTNRCCHSPWFL